MVACAWEEELRGSGHGDVCVAQLWGFVFWVLRGRRGFVNQRTS